jgi:GNAT superfamily N-acetyltransferase
VTAFLLRRPGPDDRAEVEAMHGRCSPRSIRLRWHGPRRDLPEPYLTDALRGCDTHVALIAVAGRQVIALASATSGGAGAWELGVLVEDAWQRRGVGAALVGELLEQARECGAERLTAQVLPEQATILQALQQVGRCVYRADNDTVSVVATLTRQPGVRRLDHPAHVRRQLASQDVLQRRLVQHPAQARAHRHPHLG